MKPGDLLLFVHAAGPHGESGPPLGVVVPDDTLMIGGYYYEDFGDGHKSRPEYTMTEALDHLRDRLARAGKGRGNLAPGQA